MADVKVRLVHPHTPGCNNQLVLIDAEYLARHRDLPILERRDSIGRRHRHAWHLWLTLICNTIDCGAVALVRHDAIEDVATETLRDGT